MSSHKPFVSDSSTMKELTFVPLLMGALLGVVFGASSLYLALKIGMTVSASIPVAVISITVFKAFSRVFGVRQATILENNITQTAGSAGESIAFGVAVTMPALLIMGYEMEFMRTMIVALLGGLLGILMMIPLRHSMIVEGHGELKFPEGTACAEVLISGEKGGVTAKTVFTGFLFGLVYKFLNVGLRLWTDVPEKLIGWFKGAMLACEVSPELLGVGYIIGPQVAAVTVAGGILSSWVLIPAITLFGDSQIAPLFPATKLIRDMSPGEIWKNYVLYIGAGAVATGGIISMIRSLPTIVRAASASIKGFKASGSRGTIRRTERDIDMRWVLGGVALLVLSIWLIPTLHMNFLGAVLVILFGFLFVTVSSRITGQIGSSSNPISGMTVATLLLTCLIFLLIGWIGPEHRVTALSVAAIVCIAASNGGTTSQDLKTGYLVGGTPRAQQIAILIGAAGSALVIGYILNLLNTASTVYSTKDLPTARVPHSMVLNDRERLEGPEAYRDSKMYRVLRVAETQKTGPLSGVAAGHYLVDDEGRFRYLVDPGINGHLRVREDGTHVQKYDAPKARLMSLIIDGILTQKLPWALVFLGAMIAITLELCGVGSLPFAVGVYLPLSSTTPIFIGGAVRWLADKRAKRKAVEDDSSPGILFSSGLIAGGAIAGIGIALMSLREGWVSTFDLSSKFPAITHSMLTPVVVFAFMTVLLYRVARK